MLMLLNISVFLFLWGVVGFFAHLWHFTFTAPLMKAAVNIGQSTYIEDRQFATCTIYVLGPLYMVYTLSVTTLSLVILLILGAYRALLRAMSRKRVDTSKLNIFQIEDSLSELGSKLLRLKGRSKYD